MQKLIELPGEVNESIITVGKFNSSSSEMELTTRQKVSKRTVELNNMNNKLDLMNPCRLLQQQQHVLLTVTWNTCQESLHSES
jgi:hypothetical protein